MFVEVEHFFIINDKEYSEKMLINLNNVKRIINCSNGARVETFDDKFYRLRVPYEQFKAKMQDDFIYGKF